MKEKSFSSSDSLSPSPQPAQNGVCFNLNFRPTDKL